MVDNTATGGANYRTRAREPKREMGRSYHIDLRRSEVGRIALLPGDPDRVQEIAQRFSRPRALRSSREFTSCGGYIGREYVVAMSTGIGGPSAAIAVEELSRLGVEVMIRVGTCGSIQRSVRVGSIVIADAAVRMEGTTHQYVMEGFPAAATPEVTLALRDAARRLKKDASVGLAASTDSFYVGQERKGFRGYRPSRASGIISDLRQARVLCFEMESSTIFTLGRIYGLKTGALFGVVGSRVTDEFRPGAGVADAIEVAIEAVRRLGDYEV